MASQLVLLAPSGRRNIEQAEAILPAITSFRNNRISSQPYKGKRITLMLKITAETAVVIETFAMLGASVRVCSSTRSFIRDDIAAAVTYNGIPVFGKQDQTLEEHKRFMNLAQDWGSDSPDVIICDSPLDDEYDTTGSDNTESRNFILKNENKWIVTDFEFLYSMAMEALRGTHAINATRELDNTDEVPLLQSHRYFLPGVLKRATKGKLRGKKLPFWVIVTPERNVLLP
ncbi:uncharacterized protein LOC129319863 isoform X2 [Prosopis cineraria]|uniref:uncharacterized protein LOC129319863 isoform X2 n=1 Tax=Prosopis cineraria TaxID=364024 RepID=UPI00240FCBD8|nr:uncharacterized protein LOC129319863 isoform X2 [Prosopis cineraria]